jgi:hypothetical protein
MATIEFDGKTFPLDDAIALPQIPDDPTSVAAADERVREALRPWHPAAANTTITRSKRGDEHVITVTIRAGIKASVGVAVEVPGSDERLLRHPVLRALCLEPECPSPALALLLELRRRYPGGLLTLPELVIHYDEVHEAARESRVDAEGTGRMLRLLKDMPQEPCAQIPWGF